MIPTHSYTQTIQLLGFANSFIWLSVLDDEHKVNLISLIIINNLYIYFSNFTTAHAST